MTEAETYAARLDVMARAIRGEMPGETIALTETLATQFDLYAALLRKQAEALEKIDEYPYKFGQHVQRIKSIASNARNGGR